jgi:hypothetical protein
MKALALLACLALTACTSVRTYDVYATGYTGGVPASIAPGTPVAVLPGTRVANPLLEQEVLAHVVRLLTTAGYPVAPLDQAQVALFVDYGSGTHPETRYDQTRVPGTTTAVLDSAGKQVGSVTTPDTYVSTSEVVTASDTWLRLTAVDAGAVRDARAAKPLWIGESKNTGANLELRRILGYLAVPAVERFGRNTAQAHVVLREADPRVPPPPAP